MNRTLITLVSAFRRCFRRFFNNAGVIAAAAAAPAPVAASGCGAGALEGKKTYTNLIDSIAMNYPRAAGRANALIASSSFTTSSSSDIDSSDECEYL